MSVHSRPTQNYRIIEYMQEFGSITQLEALRDLGVLLLAFLRGASDKAEEQPEETEEAEEKPVYIMADEIEDACIKTSCDRCPLADKHLCYSDGADIPENYRLMKEAGLIK